jgi:hypothetical protein
VSGSSSQEQKIIKTGPTEDVTPWELEPGPTSTTLEEDGEEPSVSSSIRIRSSLTLAQVQEVTPWELHPAPPALPLEDNAKESKDAKVMSGSTIKKKSSKSVSTWSISFETPEFIEDLATLYL